MWDLYVLDLTRTWNRGVGEKMERRWRVEREREREEGRGVCVYVCTDPGNYTERWERGRLGPPPPPACSDSESWLRHHLLVSTP